MYMDMYTNINELCAYIYICMDMYTNINELRAHKRSTLEDLSCKALQDIIIFACQFRPEYTRLIYCRDKFPAC